MKLSNLKALLEEHGVSQAELARILGRDKSAITLMFQGKRQLKAEEALRIADALRMPVSAILGEEKTTGLSEAGWIPFQHAPQVARKSSEVVQRKGQYFLKESGAFSEKAYALEVRDDSMNLLGILPGDVVISELDRKVRKGDVAVVQHYKGAGAQTILRRYDPPFLTACSTNQAYTPLKAGGEEVRIVSPVLKLVRLFNT